MVLDAMKERPVDCWPRGDGHIVLAEPGSPLSQKAYQEPGGSFSPSPGSFGVAIWVLDAQNQIVTTSDDLPLDQIQQRYVWQAGKKIPSISTRTPFYDALWSYVDLGFWRFELSKSSNSGKKLFIVFRSVGPAGGPLTSAIWDRNRLLLNNRWVVTPQALPDAVCAGDEETSPVRSLVTQQQSVISSNGWAFAKLGFSSAAVALIIGDTQPVFKSPLTYEKIEPQFRINVPDQRFQDCLNAQVANLMMGYVGRQTGPGEPVNYPLAWERDGAYSLMAMAKSGHLQTAKELSTYFAENDFFGGFGAEGGRARIGDQRSD
jgi:hypothetical protein